MEFSQAFCGALDYEERIAYLVRDPGGHTSHRREGFRVEKALARLMRSFESGHTNLGKMDYFAQALGVQAQPVRMDSQAKYAVLASGGGEMYLRMLSNNRPDYREKIWDQAAGSIITEEAGGRVTDLHGQELDFGQGRTLANTRGICATNGILHEQALKALREIAA